MRKAAFVFALLLVCGAAVWAENTITGYDKAVLADEAVMPELDGSAVVNLTDATPTNVFTVTLVDGEMAGGAVFYTVHCTDGTNVQVHSSRVAWTTCRNDAGSGVTGDVTVSATTASECLDGGTFTGEAWDVTTTGSTATFRFSGNTSLTPTSFHMQFLVVEHSDGSISIP